MLPFLMVYVHNITYMEHTIRMLKKFWIPWDRLGYMRIELKNVVYYGIRFR